LDSFCLSILSATDRASLSSVKVSFDNTAIWSTGARCFSSSVSLRGENSVEEGLSWAAGRMNVEIGSVDNSLWCLRA
jgi:hypothetical protein